MTNPTLEPRRLVTDLAEALRGWLPNQRWFAGKNQEIDEVRTVEARLLPGTSEATLVHAIVGIHPGDELYQVLIGVRTDPAEHLEHAMLGQTGELYCYDAIHDQELTAALIELIRQKAEVNGIRFEIEPGVELDPRSRGRVLNVEQSNSSVVFGAEFILKIFRKLVPGINQDLLLTRALAAVRCQHIAAPLASITTTFPPDHLARTTEEDTGRPAAPEECTLAMVQRFLPDAADGWAMATASVRDLLKEPESLDTEVDPGDMGGDFAAESWRLGMAVAAVHRDLDRALGHAEDSVADFQRAVDRMHARLDEVSALVPELAELEPRLRMIFDRARDLDAPVWVQRIHGDLHLGQVLRTVHGWVLIDFEGQPGSPQVERRLRRSPLRDVAGVLRSYDYAAHHLLVDQGGPGLPDLGEQSRVRALDWARRNRRAFCDGYAAGHGVDPGEHEALLRAFELDKAIYEVSYEHGNRPEWLVIPMASIARMTGAA